jgi:hypothetical protein
MKFAIGWLRYSFPLGIGASLAPVKVLYSFLPGFNVLDVLVFGGLSALLVRSTSGRWWLGPILLVAPSMFVVAWILRLLGIEDLRAGVGTGWLLSLALIPGAAFAGAYMRRRSILRRTPEGA